MITENQINEIEPIVLRPGKKKEPSSTNPMLPSFYYNALFIGSTGSGKSYKMIELIKLYMKYPIYDADGNKMNLKIVIFCPTYNSDANVVYKLLNIDEDDVVTDVNEDVFEEKNN